MISQQRFRKRLHTLHNVVRPRTLRTRLARESNLEDTRSAIRRVRRRSGTKDVDSLAFRLAGVVDGNGTFVLLGLVISLILLSSLLLVAYETYVKRILRLNTLAPSSERRHCSSYLEPFSQVCLELEADVRFGVVAVSVPRRGHGVEGFLFL